MGAAVHADNLNLKNYSAVSKRALLRLYIRTFKIALSKSVQRITSLKQKEKLCFCEKNLCFCDHSISLFRLEH